MKAGDVLLLLLLGGGAFLAYREYQASGGGAGVTVVAPVKANPHGAPDVSNGSLSVPTSWLPNLGAQFPSVVLGPS